MKFLVTGAAILKRVGGYGYRVSYTPLKRGSVPVTHYSPNCGTKPQAEKRLADHVKLIESDR